MALSTKLTQAQIVANIRREILDPNAVFVADSELNNYVEDWQDEVQNELELVWTTQTFTNTSLTTLTLTDVGTDIQRVDAVYWQGTRRLIEKSKEQLEQYVGRQWREAGTTTQPSVYYMDNVDSVSFWPPVGTGTTEYVVVFEYPQVLTFAASTSTHVLPAWTKYTATTYGAMRVFQHRGPLFNSEKYKRYKILWESQLQRLGVLKQRYFPKRAWSTIPGKTNYEVDMFNLPGGIKSDYE